MQAVGPASAARNGDRAGHNSASDTRARIGWTRVGSALVIASLASLAVLWLGYEAWRFLARPLRLGSIAIHPGAIDLVILHDMVVDWWRGAPVYAGPNGRVNNYPPASMVALAPIYGWRSETVTIAVWLATYVAALIALTALLAREPLARPGAERLIAVLVVVATYPAGATLGNGQVSVHVLLASVAALLLMRDRPPSWPRDAAAAALLLFALAKPTLAGPLALVAAVLPGGVRVAVLTGVGYLGLTVAASAAQVESLASLLGQFVARGSSLAKRGGESNLHRLLGDAGLGEWMLPASFAAAALFALVVVRCRRADPWILIGIAAVVARFWAYHRWYDDLLILPTVVALSRIALAGSARRGDRAWARTLGVAAVLLLLAPGGLYLLPAPWNTFYRMMQVGVWLAAAAFLTWIAWHDAGGTAHARGGHAGAAPHAASDGSV